MTIQRVSSGLQVVKARHGRDRALHRLVVLAGLPIALAAFIACGGDDQPAAEPTPDDGPSSSSGSTTSSGSGGPKPGSSSGDPDETVRCDVATRQSACAIESIFAFNVALTTDAECKTSLYVTGKPTPETSDFKLRRYTLKALDPCEFERDETFAERSASDLIAADDAGDVLSVGTRRVELIKGDQRVTCDGELPAAPAHYAVLARDGSVGYVGHYANVNDRPADISLTKVTITGETCAIAPFPLTGDPLTGLNGIAIDTKRRLHLADTTYSEPRAERVGIYDANGTFVSSYKGRDPAEPSLYFSPSSITPCKGGMCVDGFGSVFSFDENGVVRGHAQLRPTEELASLIRYVGTVRGPLFLIGNGNASPPKLVVNAMVRP